MSLIDSLIQPYKVCPPYPQISMQIENILKKQMYLY
jgi:hypothetical protein